ncbi:hypothetical protein CLI64_16215 [Nostoc sp. CENA543]|uniref:hypothetical protein n=1 Tax=Nostoc sp. CENA543 TaxID=1869241 RepID=UPI000CA0C9C7|nr:hypothetical protein [Nostoc sp. CENA543]AUT01803.1 hypothetical protein CLI64_16215 [Nostoc sp. CENA543]
MNIKTQLLKTLGISWLAFFITGLLISLLFAIPSVTLLIDRSYCPTAEWQQVVQDYTEIYQQYQQRRLQVTSVILFSSLGEDKLSIPPTPEAIKQLQTYGQSQLQKQLQLQKMYPQARVLQCAK